MKKKQNLNNRFPFKEFINLSYLESLGNEETKKKMLEILSKEFQEFQEIFRTKEWNENSKLPFMIVHKLSSKFSILGMQETHTFVKQIENDLKNQHYNPSDLQKLYDISEYVNGLLLQELKSI